MVSVYSILQLIHLRNHKTSKGMAAATADNRESHTCYESKMKVINKMQVKARRSFHQLFVEWNKDFYHIPHFLNLIRNLVILFEQTEQHLFMYLFLFQSSGNQQNLKSGARMEKQSLLNIDRKKISCSFGYRILNL